MDDVLDSLFPTHGQSTVVSGRERNKDPIPNTGTFGTNRNGQSADVPEVSAPGMLP